MSTKNHLSLLLSALVIVMSSPQKSAAASFQYVPLPTVAEIAALPIVWEGLQQIESGWIVPGHINSAPAWTYIAQQYCLLQMNYSGIKKPSLPAAQPSLTVKIPPTVVPIDGTHPKQYQVVWIITNQLDGGWSFSPGYPLRFTFKPAVGCVPIFNATYPQGAWQCPHS